MLKGTSQRSVVIYLSLEVQSSDPLLALCLVLRQGMKTPTPNVSLIDLQIEKVMAVRKKDMFSTVHVWSCLCLRMIGGMLVCNSILSVCLNICSGQWPFQFGGLSCLLSSNLLQSRTRFRGGQIQLECYAWSTYTPESTPPRNKGMIRPY